MSVEAQAYEQSKSHAPEGAGAFVCERDRGVDEVTIPEDRGHPTHWRCRACLSTFPVIGDDSQWECPGAWWRS